MKYVNKLKLVGFILVVPLFVLLASVILLDSFSPTPAQAADTLPDTSKLLGPIGFQQGDTEPPCDCSADNLSCFTFASKQDAQACYDYCVETTGSSDYPMLDSDGDQRACESRPNATATPAPTTEAEGAPPAEAPEDTEPAQVEATPEEPTPTPTPRPVPINLVGNGDFEFGFYPVPELGFEPPDTGQVPIGWGWYKNQAYGKYTIRNNQTFGLACPFYAGPSTVEEDEDSPYGPIPEFQAAPTFNTLALHMQSTDEMDARLGVYQTVDVVPGQDYRFSMSATIQVQGGARTLEPLGPDGEPIPQAQNHTFELYFDHTGNTDWTAIPHEKWINVPIREEKLFFSVEETEKKGESALAVIENYETTVTARSNKMTIFITGWRKWANWRTSVFNVDCVWLTPIDAQGRPILYTQPGSPSDEAQPAALTEPSQAPAADDDQPAEAQPEEAPAEEPVEIIPPSGGILEQEGNTILIIVASAIVLVGLVGAGVWNMRR